LTGEETHRSSTKANVHRPKPGALRKTARSTRDRKTGHRTKKDRRFNHFSGKGKRPPCPWGDRHTKRKVTGAGETESPSTATLHVPGRKSVSRKTDPVKRAGEERPHLKLWSNHRPITCGKRSYAARVKRVTSTTATQSLRPTKPKRPETEFTIFEGGGAGPPGTGPKEKD